MQASNCLQGMAQKIITIYPALMPPHIHLVPSLQEGRRYVYLLLSKTHRTFATV